MPLRPPLREFLWVILLASTITLLINMPLWHRLFTTNEWQFSTVLYENDDEGSYLSRIREAADGYRWIGQPFLFENREQRYPLGNVFENLLALPIHLWGWEIKTVSILADALFPFALVLALWWALRSLLSPPWRSTIITLLLLGGAMATWKRPVNPQASMLLPICYIGLFLPAWRTRWTATVARSALIGIMVYAYAYYWTYCLTAEGLLFLTVALQKRRIRPILQHAAAAFLPFLLLSLPWIALMIDLQGNQAYQETTRRLSLLDRRLPTAPHIQLRLVLLMAAITWVSHSVLRRWKESIPLLLLLASGLIVLNQNVITGKEYVFSSHYGFLLRLPLWIGGIWMLSILLQQKIVLRTIAMCSLLCWMGIATLRVSQEQWLHLQATVPPHAERMEKQAIIQTLRAFPPEQVILLPIDQTDTVTVYASHYPYFANESHLHLATNTDMWNRALVQQALFPDQPIPVRSIVGSAYLDQALADRTRCIVQDLLHFRKPLCPFQPDTYLPVQWNAFRKDAAALTANDVLIALHAAHVRYVLASSPPSLLRDHITLLQRFDTYQLYLLLPASEVTFLSAPKNRT